MVWCRSGPRRFLALAHMRFTVLTNRANAPLLLALPLAGIVGAVIALLLAGAVFRLRGLYFAVATLAFSEALRLFMVNYSGFGGATGLFLSKDPPGPHALFTLALELLAITTLIISVATRSRFSIFLRAVRDDEDAAAQIGVRTFLVKLVTFLIASFVTSIAGALQAVKVGAVEPYGSFGLPWTFGTLSIVMIGGKGTRTGPLLGALFVTLLGELLANWPALHLMITGAVLVMVLRFAPDGLAGLWKQRFEQGDSS